MSTTNGQRKALAELIHQLRPQWDRAGIYAALHDDMRPMGVLAHVAIEAALDPQARTPAVIPTRDRQQMPPGQAPTPTPARACPQCARVHDPDQRGCKVPDAERAHAGAEMARQALKAAR